MKEDECLYLPSEEEIASKAAAIRASWSVREREVRNQLRNPRVILEEMDTRELFGFILDVSG